MFTWDTGPGICLWNPKTTPSDMSPPTKPHHHISKSFPTDPLTLPQAGTRGDVPMRNKGCSVHNSQDSAIPTWATVFSTCLLHSYLPSISLSSSDTWEIPTVLSHSHTSLEDITSQIYREENESAVRSGDSWTVGQTGWKAKLRQACLSAPQCGWACEHHVVSTLLFFSSLHGSEVNIID